MNDKINSVIQAAKKANELELKKDLIIPILDNFNIINESDNSFAAKYNNYLEQFISDGLLQDGETFEDRIKKVIQSIKETNSTNELYKSHSCIMYYKDYKSANLEFKIYLQDILTGSEDDLEFIRQINSYFINPITNEFCQLTMAVGPYKADVNKKLLENIENFDEDKLINNLFDAINLIMDNIVFS